MASSAQPPPVSEFAGDTRPFTVAVVDEPHRFEWDGYVDAAPAATGYHAWAWRHVFERAFGHQCVYLAAREDSGAIRGVLPLVDFRSRLFGRFLVSLPFVNYGGVVAADDHAARALLDAAGTHAAERRCSHVELRHVERRFEDLALKQHKVTMLLRLERDVDSAWKRLDNKVRNQVRKAEKSGLTADVGGAELLQAFYPVFARNMRDLGTPVYSPRLFEEVFAQLGDRASVFVVRQDRATVAAGIGVRWRDTIEVPWASSLREYRQMAPNMLLYWTAIRHAVEGGLGTFDFGRSTPHEGTYQFKKQWGAEPVPLHWEYWLGRGVTMPDQSPKNAKFELAVRVWQRLPLWLANALGPQVVRNIP